MSYVVLTRAYAGMLREFIEAAVPREPTADAPLVPTGSERAYLARGPPGRAIDEYVDVTRAGRGDYVEIDWQRAVAAATGSDALHVHNHPLGSPRPSDHDVAAVTALREQSGARVGGLIYGQTGIYAATAFGLARRGEFDDEELGSMVATCCRAAGEPDAQRWMPIGEWGADYQSRRAAAVDHVVRLYMTGTKSLVRAFEPTRERSSGFRYVALHTVDG